MKVYVVIGLILAIIWLLIRAAEKFKNKDESKLSALKHSSTFKKPNIEMVSKTVEKEKTTNNTFEVNSLNVHKD